MFQNPNYSNQNLGKIDEQPQSKKGDSAEDVEQGKLLKCCHLCCCAVDKVLEIINKDLKTIRFSNSFLTNTFLFCELYSPKMYQVWSKHYAVHCITGSWTTPPPPRSRPRLKLALVDISSDIPTPLLSAPAAAHSQLRT